MHKIIFTIIPFLTALYSVQSIATVLTFDITGVGAGSSMSQFYGDNVTATTMGTFSYGNTGGFTPNVTVSHQGVNGNSLNFWNTGYNDLTNVIENEPEGHNGYFLTFTADTGYKVSLASLDIGNWGAAITVPRVSIVDESNTTLFSQSSIALVSSDTQSHTHLDFSNIIGQTLTLAVDTTGLGGNSDNVGLDNIQFSQVTTVPVPGAAWLFSTALFGLSRKKQTLRH